MAASIFVVPAPVAEGDLPRVVRHPARGFALLPPEGALWPLDDYTARRLRDGDIVETSPPAVDEPALSPSTRGKSR